MSYIQELPELLRALNCPEELIPQIGDEHSVAWVKVATFLRQLKDRSADSQVWVDTKTGWV